MAHENNVRSNELMAIENRYEGCCFNKNKSLGFVSKTRCYSFFKGILNYHIDYNGTRNFIYKF